MIEKFTEAKNELFLTFFLIVLVLPFFILTIFNHPAFVEDYFYWHRMERVGFFNASFSLYKYWSGRFFTHSELLISPFIYRTFEGYKLFSLFLMLSFFSVLCLFISEIFKNSINFREKFLLSLSVFFLYLCKMPTVAQGFYWLIGTTVYHNTIILILLFFIGYIHLCKTKLLRFKIIYAVVLCILAIAIASSNEVGLIVTLIPVALFFFIDLIHKKKLNWSLLLVVLAIAVTALVVLKSPGTQTRMGKFAENQDFLSSFFLSFMLLSELLISWIFNSPLLALTILLIPLFFKIIKQKYENYNIFFLTPIYAFALSIVILFMSIDIIELSMGNPFDRTVNFIYFFFLILWFYNILVIIFYLNKKYDIKKIFIPRYLYIVLICIVVMFLFINKNFRTAYSDLFTGTAYKFDKEMYERYRYIAESKSDTCIVETMQNFPETICKFEITTDPNHIYNQWIAAFFKKKAIALRKAEHIP